MDQPYFATYTGCDDLFIVCQRQSNGSAKLWGRTWPTMEAAKLNAADMNIDGMVGQLATLADKKLTTDNILELLTVSERLTDLLKWDLGGYRIERDRAAALEAAKEASPPTEAAAD